MSNKINYSPCLPQLFKKLGMDNYKSLFVIDIGASGGISNRWNIFGKKLEAIGFDPLVSEMERLNKQNRDSKIKYEQGFIVYKDLDKYYPENLRKNHDLLHSTYNSHNASYKRTSAEKAVQIKNYNYTQEHFNGGKNLVYSENFIELDDYLKNNMIADIDFIKVDTDGHDYPVLLGSEKTLEEGGVIGLEVEVQFHGASHSYGNTFSNIDQFLRSKGFSLFNLDNYFYSRSALPSKFLYGLFAQTETGQIQWGEALYFRDLADKNYSQKFNFPVTLDKVVKLACLYELHGLNDCAAELLINRAEEFNFTQHLDVLLDAVTPVFRGKQLTYKEYLQQFEQNPEEWLPKNSEKAVKKLEEELDEKQKQINQILSSRSWKITRPIRWVSNFFKH